MVIGGDWNNQYTVAADLPLRDTRWTTAVPFLMSSHGVGIHLTMADDKEMKQFEEPPDAKYKKADVIPNEIPDLTDSVKIGE